MSSRSKFDLYRACADNRRIDAQINLRDARAVRGGAMTKHPDLRYERKLWRSGVEVVAGVDEAGVGPVAGPVVAAAVIFPPQTLIQSVPASQQLPPQKPEELADRITARA